MATRHSARAAGQGEPHHFFCSIEVTIHATDSRLTLATGSITTRTAGMDIRLQADDFDFISGPESRIDPQNFVAFEDRSEVRFSRSEGGIIGTGNLTLPTRAASTILLGTAAQHPDGADWTDMATLFPTYSNWPSHVGGTFEGEEGSPNRSRGTEGDPCIHGA